MIAGRPPFVGGNSVEILETVGMTADEIEALIAKHVVATEPA